MRRFLLRRTYVLHFRMNKGIFHFRLFQWHTLYIKKKKRTINQVRVKTTRNYVQLVITYGSLTQQQHCWFIYEHVRLFNRFCQHDLFWRQSKCLESSLPNWLNFLLGFWFLVEMLPRITFSNFFKSSKYTFVFNFYRFGENVAGNKRHKKSVRWLWFYHCCSVTQPGYACTLQ